MTIGPVVGLLGDALTFSGGLLLAWDAVQKENEFDRVKRVARALQSPSMARLHVELEGIVVSDEKDVERAFIRRSAHKAAWGCRILAAGFFVLIVTRILDVFTSK